MHMDADTRVPMHEFINTVLEGKNECFTLKFAKETNGDRCINLITHKII